MRGFHTSLFCICGLLLRTIKSYFKMIQEKERSELSEEEVKPKKKKKKKSIQSISWGYLHDSSKVNERSVIGKQTLCEY